MTAKIVKAVWANNDPLIDADDAHVSLVRELASLHTLCPRSCPLVVDPNGALGERYLSSAYAWSRKFEWPWALLNADLTAEDRVLEAGGGHAVFQYALARRCRQVWNVDANPAGLEAVQYMQRKYGIGKNVFYQEGDLRDLYNTPVTRNWFDRTFCISVLEHIDDWEKAFDELLRVTRPGGVLMLTLDVNFKPSPSSEFKIGLVEASKLVGKLGGCNVDGARSVCSNTMNDGSQLAVLCLKIVV